MNLTYTATPEDRFRGLRQCALRLQQDLPDMLGASLIDDIKLSPYKGERKNVDGGVTLRVSGPLIEFYIDIVNRNSWVINQAEHPVDVYVRSIFAGCEGTREGFTDEDGYPSPGSVKRMFNFMRSLGGTELLRDIYFGKLTDLIPGGWRLSRDLVVPPSGTSQSLGHVRVYKEPQDAVSSFGISLMPLLTDGYEFKLNSSLTGPRTLLSFEDVRQAFKDHYA